MLFVVSPLLLLIFVLCVWSVNLINMCLGVFRPGFILFGTLWVSWTWVTISFPILGKFSAIISSSKFSWPFFLSSSSGTPMIQMLGRFTLSQRSLRLSDWHYRMWAESREKILIQTPGLERNAVNGNGLNCGYHPCLFTSPGARGSLLWFHRKVHGFSLAELLPWKKVLKKKKKAKLYFIVEFSWLTMLW